MTVATHSKLLSFAEARQMVERHAATLAPTEPELTGLLDAVGLVLAEDLRADRDFPPFPRATRDGYAVRAADVQAVPARLQVVGEIRAGTSLEGVGGSITVNRGEAVSIMTGAPLPAGADAVVMVEYTAEIPHPNAAKGAALGWGTLERCVEIQRRVESGENFVPQGAEARAGHLLVNKGRRLDHALICVAAAVG